MHCQIIAVGQKMPKWCVIACEEYFKRLQRFLKCSLIEIPTAIRHKSSKSSDNTVLYKKEEAENILKKISSQDCVIALEVNGQPWSSSSLAKSLADWQLVGQNIIFIIGGPDGLSSGVLARANYQWSLSSLTFPHALARVILVEQLYRAASILANHPYHRE
ncbi:MAG: 23S rRNA (pseudouridine(1915)-N(3))-methyltransferase RlmH [Candidatus Berkiellales bacterium]